MAAWFGPCLPETITLLYKSSLCCSTILFLAGKNTLITRYDYMSLHNYCALNECSKWMLILPNIFLFIQTQSVMDYRSSFYFHKLESNWFYSAGPAGALQAKQRCICMKSLCNKMLCRCMYLTRYVRFYNNPGMLLSRSY